MYMQNCCNTAVSCASTVPDSIDAGVKPVELIFIQTVLAVLLSLDV